jgi:hypothetical protein
VTGRVIWAATAPETLDALVARMEQLAWQPPADLRFEGSPRYVFDVVEEAVGDAAERRGPGTEAAPLAMA